jgi:hypothetical protein
MKGGGQLAERKRREVRVRKQQREGGNDKAVEGRKKSTY